MIYGGIVWRCRGGGGGGRLFQAAKHKSSEIGGNLLWLLIASSNDLGDEAIGYQSLCANSLLRLVRSRII